MHHICTLIGYGADAIYPWLAYQSIVQMGRENWLSAEVSETLTKFKKALEGGILKVMSKMGISTLESYKGAQGFQAIGLDPDFVQEYFTGTSAYLTGRRPGTRSSVNYLSSTSWRSATRSSAISRWMSAATFTGAATGNFINGIRRRSVQLQYAVRTGNYEAYREFANYLNNQDQRLQTIRGLLDFDIDEHESIPDQSRWRRSKKSGSDFRPDRCHMAH